MYVLQLLLVRITSFTAFSEIGL